MVHRWRQEAFPRASDAQATEAPVHVLHPGYDVDNTDGILAYLDGIVNTKVQAMKKCEEAETYDEILQKALAWQTHRRASAS